MNPCPICLEHADDVQMECHCTNIHNECLKRYILSELGNREAVVRRGGIICPNYIAGCCVAGDGPAVIGRTYLDEETLSKVARWLREDEDSKMSARGNSSSNHATSSSRSKNKNSAQSTDDLTAAFIAATSKSCPGLGCSNRETHFHGHSCHHVFSGCTQCHIQYCYRCLCTAEENQQYRGDKKSCKCGFWSNFCKPLRTAGDIEEHLVSEPYPHDGRCGCPICPECRPNRPCGTCPGDCAVCEGWLQPGPTHLVVVNDAPWVAQNERQVRRSKDEGRERLRLVTAGLTGLVRVLDPVHVMFFDQCRVGDAAAVARTLERAGVDIDTPDPADGGKTALMVAGERGNVDVVRLLLERHASPNLIERNGGHTALHLIARHGNVGAEHLEVVRLLLYHGADPNIAGRFDICPLHRACYNRSLFLIRLLLEGGSEVSRQDNIGWTALRRVCDVGHLDVIEVLLRHGADPHAPEGDGNSCVEWARTGGHEDVLAVLERRVVS